MIIGPEWGTPSTFVREGCEEASLAGPDATEDSVSSETFGHLLRHVATPARRRLLQRQTSAGGRVSVPVQVSSDCLEAGVSAAWAPACREPSVHPRGMRCSPLKRDRLEHTQDEPRAVCRRLENSPHGLSASAESVQPSFGQMAAKASWVSAPEALTSDLLRLSSPGMAFSPTAVLAVLKDLNPRTRAACALSQLVALETKNLRSVASVGIQDDFSQRSMTFLQKTLARQELACIDAAKVPPPRESKEAHLAASIPGVEAELCAMDARMAELRLQEEEMSRIPINLLGNAVAESGLPEGTIIDDVPLAASEVGRLLSTLSEEVGRPTEGLAHSRLLVRRMWEFLEKSKATQTSKAAVARNRAWTNFAGGRPKGRHALVCLC